VSSTPTSSGLATFRTLEIPLLRGREFGDEDGRTSRPVVIVNDRLARLFWPEQDAIGKAVRLPGSVDGMAEVAGVVRDTAFILPIVPLSRSAEA
jgi:hypothetical protein